MRTMAGSTNSRKRVETSQLSWRSPKGAFGKSPNALIPAPKTSYRPLIQNCNLLVTNPSDSASFQLYCSTQRGLDTTSGVQRARVPIKLGFQLGRFTMKAADCFIALCLTGPIFATSASAQTTFEFTLGGLTGDYLTRSEQMGQTAFNGLTLSAYGRAGNLDYSLSVATQIEEPNDGIPEFELGLRFADDTWKLGVSKESRHWSPSEYTSLILSQNAESIPGIYIRKAKATRSSYAILSWLGEYRGEFFTGRTNDSLNGDYALLIGNQFVFEPLDNLEIELVRTIQLGGSGQDSGAETVWRALIGDTNEGSASGVNQMAGIGVSYSFENLPIPTRIYGQVVGEDEAGGLPTCNFDLVGLESETSIFGIPSTITIENVDTRTNFSTNGFCGQTAAYNNSKYDYTHSNKVLGAAIDTGSRAFNLHVEHEFSSWSLTWMLGQQTINETSWAGHRLSSEKVDGLLASVRSEIQLSKGKLGTVISYQGFDLDTAEISEGAYFGINYSSSF